MSSTTDNRFLLDPRLTADTHALGDFALSRVLLMNDARFPWLILVPRQPGLRELGDLAAVDRHILLDELAHASEALQKLYSPHKLNIAALGNVVEQLHVHVIARQTRDAAWPRPVWGVGSALAYADAERNERSAALRAALDLLA
jgi:diadenosine tetraphosphate (Ap4A) HIT family hydrolase